MYGLAHEYEAHISTCPHPHIHPYPHPHLHPNLPTLSILSLAHAQCACAYDTTPLNRTTLRHICIQHIPHQVRRTYIYIYTLYVIHPHRTHTHTRTPIHHILHTHTHIYIYIFVSAIIICVIQ